MSDIEMNQMEEALAQAKAAYHEAPSAETDAALERAKVAIRGARYAVRSRDPLSAPISDEEARARSAAWVQPKVSWWWGDGPLWVIVFVLFVVIPAVAMWAVVPYAWLDFAAPILAFGFCGLALADILTRGAVTRRRTVVLVRWKFRVGAFAIAVLLARLALDLAGNR